MPTIANRSVTINTNIFGGSPKWKVIPEGASVNFLCAKPGKFLVGAPGVVGFLPKTALGAFMAASDVETFCEEMSEKQL